MDFYAIIAIKHEEAMKSRLPAAFHKILGRRVIDYMLINLAGLNAKEIFVLLEKEEHRQYVEAATVKANCLVGASAQDIMKKHNGAEFMVIEGAEIAPYPAIVDRQTFAEVAREIMASINHNHMENGVAIISPAGTFIGPDVKIGMDTIIHPGAIIEGATTIGEGCIIGQNCRIVDTKIGDGVEIWNSTCLEAEIGDGTTVGPFAYLRPKSIIGKNCRIGDFVEVKNAVFGDGSKAAHLSYIGDATIGEKVNIGCGTITVNYDGKNKSRTVVEDGAFIGSGTNLIAPVTVGKGAYTAAGSTITHDVPPWDLAIARARQENKDGWATRRGKT
ncbi:MAG: hypothetical protein FWC76_07495 [Defluviitaleaceae bacterium]|nr:hypothetical protein [Defluviitaleaceae bacterium]